MDAKSAYNTEFFKYRGINWSHHTSLDILQRCHGFKLRPNDVIIVSYPRTGTIFMQEILWQIVNHDTVQKNKHYGSISERVPFLEMNEQHPLTNCQSPPAQNPIDFLPNLKTKRLIKTHLPFPFIRDQFERNSPKIVFLMRNPKDNVVSRYNFSKGLGDLTDKTTFDMFWEIYMDGSITYGDFCDFHREYWSLRDRDNVLIVRYEDLVYQPFQEIHKIALFLGYSLSAEKIAMIAHNTTFDVLSKNKKVNFDLKLCGTFLQTSNVGDWKNWITVAQSGAMDAWVNEKLGDVGLRFAYG